MQIAYLEIKDAKGPRQVPLDGGPLTIGRNFTNLLVIEEAMASRFHCVIEKTSDGFHCAIWNRATERCSTASPSANRPWSAATSSRSAIPRSSWWSPPPAPRLACLPKSLADTAMAELAELVSDEDESDGESEAAPEPVVASSEYERQLRERAEALADRAFQRAADRPHQRPRQGRLSRRRQERRRRSHYHSPADHAGLLPQPRHRHPRRAEDGGCPRPHPRGRHDGGSVAAQQGTWRQTSLGGEGALRHRHRAAEHRPGRAFQRPRPHQDTKAK